MCIFDTLCSFTLKCNILPWVLYTDESQLIMLSMYHHNTHKRCTWTKIILHNITPVLTRYGNAYETVILILLYVHVYETSVRF